MGVGDIAEKVSFLIFFRRGGDILEPARGEHQLLFVTFHTAIITGHSMNIKSDRKPLIYKGFSRKGSEQVAPVDVLLVIDL